MILPDRPLELDRDEALRIEGQILAAQPFEGMRWLHAIEGYLVLRWALGLGPATVAEIGDALVKAGFGPAKRRHIRSVLNTIYDRMRDGKYFVTDPRRQRSIAYRPSQYAFPPNPEE